MKRGMTIEYLTQARVQGGGGPGARPPPLEIEKQKKKKKGHQGKY